MGNQNSTIKGVVKALADGSESVRNDPSEQNYSEQEKIIEKAGNNTKNRLASTSLWLGIIGAITIFIFGPAPACLLGIPAIITAIISLNQISKNGGKGKASAIIGLILGILPVLFMFLLILLAPIIADVFNQINSSLNQ